MEGSYIDSWPNSTTGYDFVVDFGSATNSDSAAEERFRTTILQLAVGIFRKYDQLWCSMYMNTAIVGSLSGNVQIPHNCNTR